MTMIIRYFTIIEIVPATSLLDDVRYDASRSIHGNAHVVISYLCRVNIV